MASSIGPRLADFLQSGASLLVATRDAANAPAVVRAGGCRVDGDGRVTLLLAAEQAQRCLDDVAANGHVALLCVMPQTYECYQLKGAGARVAPATDADRECAAAYRAALFANLKVVGIDPAAAAGLLPADTRDFVGVSFAPAEIHCNTPGPVAGDEFGRGGATR